MEIVYTATYRGFESLSLRHFIFLNFIMWIQECSKFYPGLDPKAVWQVWTDIDHWAAWHDDLEYCKLADGFKVGGHFTLKPKKGPAAKVVLTEIDAPNQFTDCAKFLGAKMYNTHTIQPQDSGVLLSNKLYVTGPLRWLWIKLVAQSVANGIPGELDALVKLAQEKTA